MKNESFDSKVLSRADVSGSIKELTFNTEGVLHYLVYKNADGIIVVYTNDSSTTTVKSDDNNVVTVPTPKATAVPTPNKSTPTPQPTVQPTIQPENKLSITIVKVNSITDDEITGASLVIKQNDTVVATLDSSKSTNTVALPAGEYVLHEESAPPHYLKADDIHFSIKAGKKNKLELSGSSSEGYSKNNKIIMKDPPVTQKIVFWAADTNKQPINGITLQITGDLGNRDDPNTPDIKEDDTKWISAASAGHTLDIPLTPGKEYMFCWDKDNNSNPDYNAQNTIKVKITVNSDGSLKFTGEEFDDTKGNYYIEESNGFTNINLVFPKKKSGKKRKVL